MTVTMDKRSCKQCEESTIHSITEDKELLVIVCDKCKTVSGKGTSSFLVVRIA